MCFALSSVGHDDDDDDDDGDEVVLVDTRGKKRQFMAKGNGGRRHDAKRSRFHRRRHLHWTQMLPAMPFARLATTLLLARFGESIPQLRDSPFFAGGMVWFGLVASFRPPLGPRAVRLSHI